MHVVSHTAQVCFALSAGAGILGLRPSFRVVLVPPSSRNTRCFLLPLAGGSFRSFTRLYHGRQSLSHSSIWESFRSRLGSSASASPHKQTLPYTQTTGAACINTLWTQVFPAAASCPALKNGSFRKEIVVFAGQSPALKDRTFLPCCNFFPIFC